MLRLLLFELCEDGGAFDWGGADLVRGGTVWEGSADQVFLAGTGQKPDFSAAVSIRPRTGREARYLFQR